MMLVEGAIRFPVVPHDVRSRVVHIASCHLPYSHTNYTATLFTRRNQLVNNRIRAASHVEKNGKSSYHPFEEIADPQISGDARLTPAETSRTIIQVNSKATMVFSVLINDEDHENVNWPDVPYLTDEHGNIYFRMKDGEDVLQSLTSENNFVQVIVGVDTVEMISEMDLSGPSEINFGFEEIDDEDSDNVDDNDEEDEDEDDNNDYDTEWVSILSDEDEEVDAEETSADWAKLETMRSSHPMNFAIKHWLRLLQMIHLIGWNSLQLI